MRPVGRSRPLVLAGLVAWSVLGAGCGAGGGPAAGPGAKAGPGVGGGAGAPASVAVGPSGSSGGGAASSAADPVPSTAAPEAEPATPTATPTGAATLPGASRNPRSAPADGDGTALLRAVRVGRGDGFERIVFEFSGPTRPGYRIRWVDGPIQADGSGAVVEVAGAAHLEVLLEPASGVDPTDGTLAYPGPDRVAVAGRTDLLTDLLRTGDFEAVLTWVAGARSQVPFRVLNLQDPTRLVVDVQAG